MKLATPLIFIAALLMQMIFWVIPMTDRLRHKIGGWTLAALAVASVAFALAKMDGLLTAGGAEILALGIAILFMQACGMSQRLATVQEELDDLKVELEDLKAARALVSGDDAEEGQGSRDNKAFDENARRIERRREHASD